MSATARTLDIDTDYRPAILLAFLGIVSAAFGIGYLQGGSAPEPVAEPVLMQVEVISVQSKPEWVEDRTLVEYEDGTREVLRTHYGEPGDTFMIRRSP